MSDPAQPTTPPGTSASAPAFATTIQAKGKRWTRRLIIAAVVIMVIGVISRLGGGGDAEAKPSVKVAPALAKPEAKPAPSASQAQMDRLRTTINSTLPTDHPPEVVMNRKDGSVFSVSWPSLHIEDSPLERVGIVLNNKPVITIVRYVEESAFADPKYPNEEYKMEGLDSIKIASAVIEKESGERITWGGSDIVGFINSNWKEVSKRVHFSGTIKVDRYEVFINVIKRLGDGAVKDGSAGRYSLLIEITIPVEVDLEKK